MARSDRKPFWQRWYSMSLLLGFAGYGWYLFNERQMIIGQDRLNDRSIATCSRSCSSFRRSRFSRWDLFFLRRIPVAAQARSTGSAKVLPVPLYLTLTQLSRSSKAYYPLMILLILTLGLGVYNASAARTIDLNSTERTLYQYGTDVIVQTVWEGKTEVINSRSGSGGDNGSGGGNGPANGGKAAVTGEAERRRFGRRRQGATPAARPSDPKINYSEPPFEMFRHLDGVEAGGQSAADQRQHRRIRQIDRPGHGHGHRQRRFRQGRLVPQRLVPGSSVASI